MVILKRPHPLWLLVLAVLAIVDLFTPKPAGLVYASDPATWVALISIAISVAAALLQKKPGSAPLDDKLQSSATRGSFIPLVIGRYRLGPVFAFVSDATENLGFADFSGTPGFGKGGGGGEPGPSASYHENALHLLSIGPGSRLVAIYENGESLWRGPITPSTHPSGTQIQVSTGSAFKIYWGFEDDPQIDLLEDDPAHGLAVRYALCLKVLWIPKNLGAGRTWPRLEYEFECPCYSHIAQTASELPLQADDAHPTLGDMDAELENWQTTSTRALAYVADAFLDVPTGRKWLLVRDPYQSSFPNVNKYRWALRQGSIIKVAAKLMTSYGDIPWVMPGPTFPAAQATMTEVGFSSPSQWKYFWIKDCTRALYLTTSYLLVELGPEVTGNYIANLNSSVPALTNPSTANRLLGLVRPIDSEGTDGVNLIHAIDQLLFARKPYGAGKDRSMFDERSIEAAARAMELEQIRSCVVVQNGESVESVVATLMQDAGLFISWDPQIGKFVFLLQRYDDPSVCANLPADMILRPPQMLAIQGPRPVDTLAFSYKDRRRNYREETIALIDNGQVGLYDSQKAKRATISCTTDGNSAARMVPRRQQEALANMAVVTFEVNHAGKMALAGKRLRASQTEDADLLFRITAVKRDINSQKVILDTLLDNYDPIPSVDESFTFTDAPPSGGNSRQPEEVVPYADATAIEPPRLLGPDLCMVFPLIRATKKTSGGTVWGSRTGDTYAVLGDATICVACELVDPLSEDGPCFDEGTYSVVPVGADFDAIEDLSVDPDSWLAGRQILLVGDEVIYLRNAAGDALQGLVRGRAGTRVAAHPAGARCYVVLSHLIKPITSSLFVPQRTISYKVQPWEGNRFGSVDDAPVQSVEVQARAFTPLAPTAVRQRSLQTSYDSAETLEIVWSWHSSTFPRTGLGMQAFGAAAGVSPPRGHFVARVVSDVGAVVLESILPGPSLILDAAVRAEIGIDSLPYWTLEVVAVEGSFTSAAATLTLEPA